MFKINEDYYAYNPRNHDDWNKHPITIYKRTKCFIWVYHKHMIKDDEFIRENKCKKFKLCVTNDGHERIKINDAIFVSN